MRDQNSPSCSSPTGAMRRPRVLIVESLSPTDLLEDYREARATMDVLRTLQVAALTQSARSTSDLQSLCRMFAAGEFDVLHIVCHGCRDGIGVSDGDVVPWLSFANMLGTGIDGKTLVLSACEGGCANLPKLFAALPHRPAVIVGPAEEVAWDALLVGMQVYYRSVLPIDPSRAPDPPCVAISRAQLAAQTGLVVHQWSAAENSYEKFEPHAACSLEVMIQTHGLEQVKKASLSVPCCGGEWQGYEEVMKFMDSMKTVSPDEIVEAAQYLVESGFLNLDDDFGAPLKQMVEQAKTVIEKKNALA